MEKERRRSLISGQRDFPRSAADAPHSPCSELSRMTRTTVEGLLERSGSRIHYWITGPKDAPLVTFTPGATMDHQMFDAQPPAVVGARYVHARESPLCSNRSSGPN